jgi:predicted CoA-binding protein
MESLREAARDFLAHRRVAVVGVSRGGDTAANVIYRRMRRDGYEVFAVNPNATEVEGDPCWPALDALPDGVETVVVGTPPDAAAEVVAACARAGVRRVWLHRSFGTGSVDPAAVELARRHGMAVLAGGCPMMYLDPVDPAHRCFRWLLGATGKLPDGRDYV